MTIPAPSRFRTVRIFGERAPMRSRGLVGPTTRYKLPPIYPLVAAWSWVDATIWCQDGTPETLLPPAGTGWSPTDGKLLGFDVGLYSDGMHVGLRPRIASGGLAPNTVYVVTLHLIGATTGKEDEFQIDLPTLTADALPTPDPTRGVFNGDTFNVAGIPIFTGASE